MRIQEFIEAQHAFIAQLEDRLDAYQRTSDDYYLEDLKEIIHRKKKATSSLFVETHFSETTSESFLERIKKLSPDLTSHELRICTLLRLNYSSKSIAESLHIKPSSVDVARHRIRKKIELPHHRTLTEFLNEI